MECCEKLVGRPSGDSYGDIYIPRPLLCSGHEDVDVSGTMAFFVIIQANSKIKITTKIKICLGFVLCFGQIFDTGELAFEDGSGSVCVKQVTTFGAYVLHIGQVGQLLWLVVSVCVSDSACPTRYCYCSVIMLYD